jgi:hypothetical protein
MEAGFARFSLLTALTAFLLVSACGRPSAPQQGQAAAEAQEEPGDALNAPVSDIASHTPGNLLPQGSGSAEAIAPGCGSVENTSAPRNESGHPLAAPRGDRAIIYVVQDDRNFDSWHRPTVDWGIDGQWFGATKGNSYFYVYVTPGEHHICAEWRAGMIGGRFSDSTPFIADAGKVYYFHLTNVFSEPEKQNGMRLTPMDDYEAQPLLASFRHSIYQPQK